MRDVGYIVAEANGLRTYRCSACGSQLTYLVENVDPARLSDIDRVARELSDLHCRGECRKSEGARARSKGERE